MNRKISSLVWVGAMSLAITGCSDQASSEYMTQLDQDQNGSLSSSEAAVDPQLSASFFELDQDGNGELSEGEFSKFEATEQDAPAATPQIEESEPTERSMSPEMQEQEDTGNMPAPTDPAPVN